MGSATVAERRRRPRSPSAGGGFKLSYEVRTGVSQVVSAKLIDFHEEGCGLEVGVELPAGLPVVVEGTLAEAGGIALRTKAFVSWSRPNGGEAFRIGVQFDEPLTLRRKNSESDWRGSTDDLYEVLQISPNADSETIQRVYRLLAQRYHPDNQETANPEMFRKVLDAYKILSDPETRAGYDSQHQGGRERRWRIFNQGQAVHGIKAEKAKREGIMGLLYTKRVNEPTGGAMEVREFERLLGVPREHLEFSLWYLREQGMVTKSDNGRYQITVRGVDRAEEADVAWAKPGHLITAT